MGERTLRYTDHVFTLTNKKTGETVMRMTNGVMKPALFNELSVIGYMKLFHMNEDDYEISEVQE